MEDDIKTKTAVMWQYLIGGWKEIAQKSFEKKKSWQFLDNTIKVFRGVRSKYWALVGGNKRCLQ